MEGAQPSVLAGLVSVPVVAGLVSMPVVAGPTSVGYGVGTGGVAAALAMLNSCAEGVSVVNFDNGFGAGRRFQLVDLDDSDGCCESLVLSDYAIMPPSKTTKGTIVMSRNSSPFCRTLPFFATVAVMAITASGADSLLLHRWSFNNDFADSAGGQTATATNYSFVAHGGGYAVKMAGGANGTSFVDLGKDILPNALPPQKNAFPSFAQGAGIWHNRCVEPFRRAKCFLRVSSSRVAWLANGAEEGFCN